MAVIYSSNILHTQSLATNSDIFVSFLIQNPFSSTVSDAYSKKFDGFGVFLIDSSVPYLTGGGSGNGVGLITDQLVTSLSAVSGHFISVIFDNNGKYGQVGGVDQFTTGSSSVVLSGLAVRCLSTFDYIGNTQINRPPYIFDEDWFVFRVAFKQNMQKVVFYDYVDDVYVPMVTYDTGIVSTEVPPNVRVGITWSGRFPIKVKNININATVDS